MAFEFNQTNLFKLKKEKVCEFAVSGKLSSDDGENVVGILKCSYFPQINTCEITGNIATVLGQTNVEICYLKEDGSAKNMRGAIEWQNKCEVGEIDDAKISAKIKDAQVEIQNNAVYFSCLIELGAEGTMSVGVYNLAENENVAAKKTSKEIKSICAYSKEKFTIAEDISLEGADNVICVCPQIETIAAVAGENKAQISGTAYLEIICETENGVSSTFKAIDFSEEIALLGATIGGEVYSSISVENCEYIFTPSEEKGQLSVTISAVCENVCYKQEEVELTTDAYALHRQTKQTSSCEELQSVMEYKTESKQTTFAENCDCLDGFDEFVCASVYGGTEWFAENEEGGTNISGSVAICLVYKTEEGKMRTKITHVPYNFSVEEANAEIESVVVKNLAAKVRGAHEIVLDVSFDVGYFITTTDYLEFISGLEDCGELEDDDSAIMVAIAGENDDAFSLGKRLHAKPEDVLSQNENASFAAGEKVFVYKHKEENFNY